MLFEDLLVIILISPGHGFALGFFYVRAQDHSHENRYREGSEKWKLESAGGIWIDSVNRYRSALKRRITEQTAPVLPGFFLIPPMSALLEYR